MGASEELGIVGLHSIHYLVGRPERSKHFYGDRMGWRHAWQTSPDMEEDTGQTCSVYEAGEVRVAVSSPLEARCRAGRYLTRHPAGIGSLAFLVEDVDQTWRFLEGRSGTMLHDIRATETDDGGRFRHFSIATALGDTTFRFLDLADTDVFAPGFERVPSNGGNPNPLGFQRVDHITANAQTMASAALWFEHVLGFEKFWDIQFHTEDVRAGGAAGTGLKSMVFRDSKSDLKFPINEPLAPFFKEGQINRFIEDNHGAGIQHIALSVDDAVATVRAMRAAGVSFLETPPTYYDLTPARLASQGVDVSEIDHDLDVLRELGILIDGSPEDRYLIQIFLKDAMTLYDEPDAGPFFYEIIERCGDPGFGAGNFRALFEAIEREQV